MTFRLAKVVRGYQPVHCLSDGLISWRRGRLYRSDFDLGRFEPICDLPTRFPLLTRFAPRLIGRVLRFGIRSSVVLDGGDLLVAQRGEIFRVSLDDGRCELELRIPDNRRLLALSMVSDASGNKAACFGEYFHNPAGAGVNIWRRSADGAWRKTASFPADTIEHIHNICQTPDGTVYVLAGDLREGTGIWRSNFELDRLVPVMTGSQRFRACWLWQSQTGDIYYATDSHLEGNALRSFSPGSTDANEVAPISGSSIYAGMGPDYVCFSSSVEPGEPSGRTVRDFTERRRGPGISDDFARIYLLAEGKMEEILAARMDGWPLRLAQFATFSFPSGNLPDNRMFAYGRAVRRYDGSCLMFERQA